MSGLLSTYNYIVPAAGTTHGYQVSGVLSTSPIRVDFRDVSISGQQFIPSGVFIDNSQGTGPITISFQETAYQIQCAAGQAFQTQYPATAAQTALITGLGQASVIFVDFPVIPFVNAGGTASTLVTAADGGIATLGTTTDAAQTNSASAATLIALNKGQIQALFATGANAMNFQGNVASGAADVGNPIKVGGRYNSSVPSLTNGQRVDLQTDSAGNLSVVLRDLAGSSATLTTQNGDTNSPITIGLNVASYARYYDTAGNTWARQKGSAGDGTIVKPYAFTTSDWTYAAASGGIVNTTAVAIKAAAGAGVRNYLTGISIQNTAAVASEFQILDGATVIYRGIASASMAQPTFIQFATPLRTTANTALNVQMVTTATVTYFNAQGYVAP